MSHFSPTPRIALPLIADSVLAICGNECRLIEVAGAKFDRYSVRVHLLSYHDIYQCIQRIATSTDLSFESLMDICACDYPDKAKRFEVFYQFLSIKNNVRLTLSTEIAENEIMPSVNDIYKSANWLEREIYDLFGIPFARHPDLRRILTDYGFVGYPMRKDFPLYGHLQVSYDQDKAAVRYEKVKLSQPYRDMHFESPWHGTKYILPGDEKASK